MDSGYDPNEPLLQYRNAQLSDFNKSPAELLFNRPFKTKLPVMPNALLSTASNLDTHSRLQQRQQRQKFYYDRGTRDFSPLQFGDVVCVNNKQWLRGIISILSTLHLALIMFLLRLVVCNVVIGVILLLHVKQHRAVILQLTTIIFHLHRLGL